jgi:hypothetical protein
MPRIAIRAAGRLLVRFMSAAAVRIALAAACTTPQPATTPAAVAATTQEARPQAGIVTPSQRESRVPGPGFVCIGFGCG